jgi:allantoinase
MQTTPEGGLILFHAEMGDPVHGLGTDQSYTTFLQSRPDQWECTAIEMIIRLLSEQARDPSVVNPTRAHIVHLSSALALPMIREARKAGLPLTVETCFHYLVLSSDSVPGQHDPHRQSTEYKCCPPIRDESNREALWAALEDGSIDYVVSDHSPCLPEMKAGGFMDAWGGISALGLGFSLLWTEVTRRNKLKAAGQLDGQEIGIERIVKWCCENTAEQVGLAGVKGVVHPGADADFAIFNPEIFFEVSLHVPDIRISWLIHAFVRSLPSRSNSKTRCRHTSARRYEAKSNRPFYEEIWCSITKRA